jgi:hypothetical protein
MSQAPESVVRRLIEEGFNEGNLDVGLCPADEVEDQDDQQDDNEDSDQAVARSRDGKHQRPPVGDYRLSVASLDGIASASNSVSY